MAAQDSGVYGTQDVFGTDVPASAIGPLLTYGSLRQVRDVLDGGVVAESGTHSQLMARGGKYKALVSAYDH